MTVQCGLFLQLEDASVLRRVTAQPLTPSQRQTVTNLVGDAITEASAAAFDQTLLARLTHDSIASRLTHS